jgi:hypothetical protein
VIRSYQIFSRPVRKQADSIAQRGPVEELPERLHDVERYRMCRFCEPTRVT